MDRFNQMTGQADLIAKKKLEIEAKLKLQREAAQNSGSIAIYNQLAASSKNTSPAETSSSNQRRKKALPIGNLKNRWGFKGKSITESERTPATKNLSNETKNTFSNDGSFLEQFKKMQQKSGIEESSKASSHKSEYFDGSKSKQSSLSLGYTISSSSDSHKSILTSPPPPPPSQLDSKHTASQDNSNKPKEADEWYKQALERARNIAKNIGQSSSTSKGSINDISPQSSSSSSMIYSPHQKQAPNYDIEPKPDFSVPPPPVLSNLMHQPPPSISNEYGKYNFAPHAIENSSKSSEQDNDSNAGKYSPSKPTCTPTKVETSVTPQIKIESKGKHNMGRKRSKTICHEIIWTYERLLMGILKFS